MLLPAFEFHQPQSLDGALQLKKELGSKARFLAGGTDLLVHLKKKLITADALISLQNIPDISVVSKTKERIFIGAGATMSQLSADPIIQAHFPAIKSGCDNLGTHLIRNRATIGGNACNASPAGDTLPSLMVYGAEAVLGSTAGIRTLPLEDFFTGPGKTAMAEDELLTGFELPLPPVHSGAHYIQLGKRKSSEINVVNAASYLEFDPDNQTVTRARIALGSVAPTPILAANAMEFMAWKPADEEHFYQAGEIARRDDCTPIDDFRGSADYRRAMVGVLTKRTLTTALERAQQA
ncbi:MAG: xanthine dehydrogenase family protein subunit M [Desulfobacterales bacterium]|nr:xanthine dehydrogenase family protein subunit M [Desulfobacterales bacterium]